MPKSKFMSFILIFMIAFSTIFSFSVSNATNVGNGLDEMTNEQIAENLKSLQTENPLEMVLSKLLISVGDFVSDYMTFLLKDEITVDRIIFNRVASLNANFFGANDKVIVPDSTKILCNVINGWYAFFKGIAIVIYLIVLVYVGVKIILRNSNGKR